MHYLQTGTFAANYQQRFIVDYDAIQARMRENSVQLLDTREPIHFRGQAQEPNQCMMMDRDIEYIRKSAVCPSCSRLLADVDMRQT